MRQITVQDVLGSVRSDYRVVGESDTSIERALPIDEADERSITFCNKKGELGERLIGQTSSRMIITSYEHETFCGKLSGKTCILVEDPRLAFARVLEEFFSVKWPSGVHPSSLVHGSVKLGSGVYIGPFCSVGSNVEIGDNSRLEASVTVYDNAKIGKNVIIRAGVIIGTDGFGFNRNPEGELEKFPQIGGVVIEDDVEIGSNSCIARGALLETRIGKGTKIDNLVHISHNVQIGEQCIITALVWIGGSAKIGDRCWLSPSSSIINGAKVGNDVMVAMGSVVTKDVGSGEFVAGNPARPTIRK